MRHCTRVDLPTLGGPTTAISTGGGSTGDRSTTGMWCFFSLMSSVLGAGDNTGEYLRSRDNFCLQHSSDLGSITLYQFQTSNYTPILITLYKYQFQLSIPYQNKVCEQSNPRHTQRQDNIYFTAALTSPYYGT